MDGISVHTYSTVGKALLRESTYLAFVSSTRLGANLRYTSSTYFGDPRLLGDILASLNRFETLLVDFHGFTPKELT